MSDEQSAAAFGGWSEFTCAINAEAKQAFTEAMEGFVGVRYTPFAVSQQLVAGMNYRFLCNGTPATLLPVSGLYSLHIFKPLGKGPAKLIGIVSLNP